MMEPRDGPMPYFREECARGYGKESHPDATGVGDARFPWVLSDTSSQSSFKERRLGKAPGVHPESQQSSPANSLREYELLQSGQTHQVPPYYYQAGMQLPGPMSANPAYWEPGTSSEPPPYPHIPAVPANPVIRMPPGLEQFRTELNFVSPREVFNASQLPYQPSLLAHPNRPGLSPANVHRPGGEHGGGPPYQYLEARFQASAHMYAPTMQAHANAQWPVGGEPSRSILLDDQLQHAQPQPHVLPATGGFAPSRGRGTTSRHESREPWILGGSSTEDENQRPLPQRQRVPQERLQAFAYGDAQLVHPGDRAQRETGARCKEYPGHSNLTYEQHGGNNQDKAPGRQPYRRNQDAEPYASPATSYVASDTGRATPRGDPVESCISNRPETEGGSQVGQRGREREELEFPHCNLSPTAPEPRPDDVMKKSLSKTDLARQRTEKTRDQHRHIEQNCSQTLTNLHEELVELSKVQYIMDLWQYIPSRPRTTSLVGCYHWYYKKSEPTILSLINSHKGTGDDSAAHHVFSLMMESDMKTGNLIHYFKDQGRLDIVKLLRELHPVCPVCDQLN